MSRALAFSDLALCGLLAASSCVSAQVYAHAPPEVAKIVWRDTRSVVLVTNRGLMFGDLESRAFRLMCNEALHVTTTEVPQVVYRGDGALLAATSRGLFLSQNQGCSWQGVAPLVDLFVPALAQHASSLDTLYAGTFGPGQSAIRVTRDGGRSWTPLRALGDRDYTRSLLVAPGNASLLYATGTEFDEPPEPRETHYIARSADGGQSWQRQVVTLQEGELALLLLAVNPRQGDELLLRAMSASPGFMPERLLVSHDGGRTLSAPLSLPDFAAATFAADGSAAWVAGREGIFRAGAALDHFERIGQADYVTCLDAREGHVYACGHYAGNEPGRDGIGSTELSGTAFGEVMNFRDVTEPVSCDAAASTAIVCPAPWRDFRDEVVLPLEVDAGPDADAAPLPGLEAGQVDGPPSLDASVASEADAGAVSPPAARHRDSGCSTLPARDSGLAWPLAVAGALCAAALARRRRPRS